MRTPQDILKKPIVSERSMGLTAENKYSFYVAPKSNMRYRNCSKLLLLMLTL